MATNKNFRIKQGIDVAQGGVFGGTLTATGLTAANLIYPTSDGSAGHVLTTDGSGNLTFAASAGNFVDLADTPSTLTGQGGKVVQVNAGGTALEFGAAVGVGQSSRESFTGDGTTTVFTLTAGYAGQNDVFVFVDGVIQYPGTHFTMTGSSLTFTAAPVNQAQILIHGTSPVGTTVTPGDGTVTADKLAASAYTRDIFTGNGSTAAYNLTSSAGSPFAPFVFVGGVLQDPTTHYTIDAVSSPNTITFTSNVPNGTEAVIVYGPVNVTGIPSDGTITTNKFSPSVFTMDTFTGDGATQAFTLSVATTDPKNLWVTVAGVPQTPTTAYTTNNLTLTFTGTPANGAAIVVRHIIGGATSVPADNSVTSAKIVDGTIVAADIANATIPKTKLSFNPEDDAVALSIALG
jgi:hypothetical protein